MSVMKRWLGAAALAALCGCAGGAPSEQARAVVPPAGGEQQGAPQVISNVPADAGAPVQPQPPPTPPPVTVVAGTNTPLPEGAHPRVSIVAPRDNQVIRGNRVEVRLRVSDWPAPQEGRHVHVIVDNEPYIRVDDPSRPVVLENLSEGTHVLRVFPGRANHESVKDPGAFALAVFHVGRRTPGFDFNRTAPLLTYSRPKGEYRGEEAARILLDFFISNVPNNQLAPNGYRVRYVIRQGSTEEARGELTQWVPYWIENLPDGEHTIVLELLGPDGQPVPGMFNRTERTITVNRAAAAEAHGHMPPAQGSTTPSPGISADAGTLPSAATSDAGHAH